MSEQTFIKLEISRKLKDGMMAAAEKAELNEDSKISAGKAAVNHLRKSSTVRPLLEFLGDENNVSVIITEEDSKTAKIVVAIGKLSQTIQTKDGELVSNKITTSDGTVLEEDVSKPKISGKQLNKLSEEIVSNKEEVGEIKEEWLYTNPTTKTEYLAGSNDKGEVLIKFDDEWEVVNDKDDRDAILNSKPKKLSDLTQKLKQESPKSETKEKTKTPEPQVSTPEPIVNKQEESGKKLESVTESPSSPKEESGKTGKEVSGDSKETIAFLKIIAKNFGSIPWMARDLNVARQNTIKMVKAMGGEATNKADAMFMKESDLEKKLQSEQEKLKGKSPEQVKGDEEKTGKKKDSFLKKASNSKLLKGTKLGKALGVADMMGGIVKCLAKCFGPKIFLVALAIIAIPALMIASIYQGFKESWDAWLESGSIWESFKAGIGELIETIKFGFIDKDMISKMYDWSTQAIENVLQSVADFFIFGEVFTEKFGKLKQFLGIGVKKPKLETPKEEKVPPQKPNEKVVDRPVARKGEIDADIIVDKNGNMVRPGGEVIKGTAPEAKPAPTPPAAPAPSPAPKATASESKPVKVASEQGKKAMLKAMDDAKITDETQRAAIMAQVGHESGGFAVLSENLNYKAPSLMKLFPRKFSGPDDAQKVAAGGPVSVAERIYGGRMGNAPEGGGEGFKFRGRGFIQLTGKQNYTRFGVASNPDSVSNLKEAADTAIKYMAGYKGSWGDIKAVTKFVNGGYIGLDDRQKHFQSYLNDATITKIGAVQSAPSGGEISSSSGSVASSQRQQAKPKTPVIINAAQNNTTVVNKTENKTAPKENTDMGKTVLARA